MEASLSRPQASRFIGEETTASGVHPGTVGTPPGVGTVTVNIGAKFADFLCSIQESIPISTRHFQPSCADLCRQSGRLRPAESRFRYRAKVETSRGRPQKAPLSSTIGIRFGIVGQVIHWARIEIINIKTLQPCQPYSGSNRG